ncbi:MAG: LD-carboxypeptidase [Desulfobacterales bacterium]|nr:LD-carboxypeptidase [Desulfobacterales bacterium]
MRTCRSTPSCARGAGTTCIRHVTGYARVAEHPKAVIGFSDVTALLWALYSPRGLIGFHGPLVTTLADAAAADRTALWGCRRPGAPAPALQAAAVHSAGGRACAPVAGGNLAASPPRHALCAGIPRPHRFPGRPRRGPLPSRPHADPDENGRLFSHARPRAGQL